MTFLHMLPGHQARIAKLRLRGKFPIGNRNAYSQRYTSTAKKNGSFVGPPGRCEFLRVSMVFLHNHSHPPASGCALGSSNNLCSMQ